MMIKKMYPKSQPGGILWPRPTPTTPAINRKQLMGALITTPDILPLAPSLYNPTHAVFNNTSD